MTSLHYNHDTQELMPWINQQIEKLKTGYALLIRCHKGFIILTIVETLKKLSAMDKVPTHQVVETRIISLAKDLLNHTFRLSTISLQLIKTPQLKWEWTAVVTVHRTHIETALRMNFISLTMRLETTRFFTQTAEKEWVRILQVICIWSIEKLLLVLIVAIIIEIEDEARSTVEWIRVWKQEPWGNQDYQP